MLRLLLVHNRYLIEGGEDTVFLADRQLLQDHGHQVTSYELDNQVVAQIGRLRTAFKTVWSQETYSDIRMILQRDRECPELCVNGIPYNG